LRYDQLSAKKGNVTFRAGASVHWLWKIGIDDKEIADSSDQIYIRETYFKPRISKPLAMTFAVASHSFNRL
jgi:hypothetical protein